MSANHENPQQNVSSMLLKEPKIEEIDEKMRIPQDMMLIEPKQEIIEYEGDTLIDQLVRKMEEDEEVSPQTDQIIIPCSSKRIRSKPKKFDDYDMGYDNTVIITDKKVRKPADTKSSDNQHISDKKIGKPTIDECKICGKVFNSKYKRNRRAVDHAMTHTDIKRYGCSIPNCTYKAGYYALVFNHATLTHKEGKGNVVKIDLTSQQELEIKKMMKKCFPDWKTCLEEKLTENRVRPSVECQKCHRLILEQSKRSHSTSHLEFMLFKCIQPACEFETKHLNALTNHEGFVHGKMVDSKERYIKLTKAQESKRRGIWEECFPE